MTSLFDGSHWFVSLTADGSPTLRRRHPLSVCDSFVSASCGDSLFASGILSMHSLKGALGETDYVYVQPVLKTLKAHSNLSSFVVVNVGLGLGYVELCLVAALMHALPSLKISFLSFENDEYLRKEFMGYLSVSPEDAVQHGNYEKLKTALNVNPLIWHEPLQHRTLRIDILGRVARFYGVCEKKLSSRLMDLCASGNLILEKEASTPIRHLRACARKIQTGLEDGSLGLLAICYDAFCASDSPELWSAPILNEYARAGEHFPGFESLFMSYASTGELKRILRREGFFLIPRRGFGGKRECTWGIKKVN